MNQILKGFQALCEDCVTEGYVDSPFSTVSPGVGLQLLCLAIEGSVLMVLLVCIEELCVYVQVWRWQMTNLTGIIRKNRCIYVLEI